MNSAPFIVLSGPPRARGFTHGRALAGRLRCFLDDSLARLGHLNDRRMDLDSLRPAIAEHRAVIATALPDLADEINGLADGTGVDRDAAWLLQLRRELLGYSRFTGGDCTTYASVRSQPVLAQTVDLNGNLDDQIALLAVSGPRHRSLVLSFAGLLGYLGVNAHRLQGSFVPSPGLRRTRPVISWTRVSPKETRSTSSPRTRHGDVLRRFERRASRMRAISRAIAGSSRRHQSLCQTTATSDANGPLRP